MSQHDIRDGRRTVHITGRPDSVALVPRRSAAPRAMHRPDRIALWAVFMGLCLLVIAAASAHV